MYLKIKKLKKIFEQGRGVQEINLEVKKGEIITLLGPSGCGKTTLLNLLGGFLISDSGEIILDGTNITSTLPENRPISTVFQNYALFPHFNVLQNVGYGLKYTDVPKNEREELAKKYLKIVGLEGYEKSSVQKLSGGQQQRVALARALVLKPKILLLDEPFSNLDAKLRVDMREELKKLQKELKITMIFVTHDQEEALSLSDRIVIMNEGKIIQIGTPQEIYYQPVNHYVADFVGKANFIKIKDKEVLVRPEEIKLLLDRDGDGEIIEKDFMGASTLFKVNSYIEDIIYQVQIFGEEGKKIQIGDRVKISW
jgi:iron(III) transport system ATP-binding protein